ncbi:unnamed protein product [Pelagomonas calceolata]|uniref:cGMP-dependent protein kinase n=1 Tax=Pelagomonas calceolata TaxID=35677 RepID=A0A7S4A5I7_9STRA|nr:unnamed protein product [Pelagomonas calceolata]
MGNGSSLPSEYKQKITAAFQIKNTEAWRNADDFDDELEMRNELMNLRALAAELVKDDRRKSTVYVQPTEKSLAVKKMLHAAMAMNPFFKRCRTPEKEEMLGAFKFVHFDAKHVIIQQGDRGDEFYVLESGTVEFHVESRGKVGACGMGRGFGELALMYNTPRSASCIAATECTAWTLDRSTFRAILAKHAKKRALAYKELLKKVILNKDKHFMGPTRPLTDCITEAQLTKLAGAMDEEHQLDGTDIIREGDEGKTFYVISSGTVEVTIKDVGKVAELHEGDYFGERALVADDKRTATCTAIGNDCRVLTLDREDFVALLGSVEDLVQHGTNEEVEVVEQEDRVALDVTLEVLDVQRTLGHGAFGKVQLVMDRRNGTSYALKYQSKAMIVENSLCDHVLREREMLMKLDHPCIVKLYCSFQDRCYIYFLLEILTGGEIFAYLRKQQRFSESTCKFYANAVTQALQHMHEKRVAYRDLKPENICLDSRGYPRLVDFSLAKVVDTRTWTLCGSPDYLAPEIILNEGHDRAVDYWALGVLAFEMVDGKTPFFAERPMDVYEKILEGKYKMPPHCSGHLENIIHLLLRPNQGKRLGNGKGGVEAINDHRFFAGYTYVTARVPIKIEKAEDSDESDVENYFVEDEEEKGDDVAPEPSAWTPALDAGAEIRL